MIDLLPKNYYEKMERKIQAQIDAIDQFLERHNAIMKEVEANLNNAKDVLNNHRRPD